jgi:choline-sulfatase
MSILLSLALAAAPAAAAGPAARPNLLLVTIDTLRADHGGAYGDAAASTPALDGLARDGTLVEEAVVHVPQTRPSHATLFTGRYPYEHGIRDNAQGPLDRKWPTLAERLRAGGWDTAAVIGAYPVSRPSGLDRGFAFFDDPFGTWQGATSGDARSERPAGEVADRALAWLKRPRRAPFFLWVHFYDPHAPYEPPAPFAACFARRLYDGEVAYADS